MKTKILLVTALLGAAAMTASARVSFNLSIGLPIIVSQPAVVYVPPPCPPPVVVATPAPPCPPPVIVETVPPCPSVDYVWMGGYWNYRPTGYVWVHGGWCNRPVHAWHGYGHEHGGYGGYGGHRW